MNDINVSLPPYPHPETPSPKPSWFGCPAHIPPTPPPPPPPSAHKVKEAMNDINAAQRLRVAALEKAEAAKVGLPSSAASSYPSSAAAAEAAWHGLGACHALLKESTPAAVGFQPICCPINKHSPLFDCLLFLSYQVHGLAHPPRHPDPCRTPHPPVPLFISPIIPLPPQSPSLPLRKAPLSHPPAV